MNYFADCTSKDAVKKKFRELAKKLHPDHGGTQEEMVELQKQYENWGTHSNSSWEEKMKNAYQSYSRYYNDTMYGSSFNVGGGYGRYRSATAEEMRSNYFNQQQDPRIADYERLKSAYNDVCNTLNRAHMEMKWLKEDYEILKKKLERLKKKMQPTQKQSKAKKGGVSSQSICL